MLCKKNNVDELFTDATLLVKRVFQGYFLHLLSIKVMSVTKLTFLVLRCVKHQGEAKSEKLQLRTLKTLDKEKKQ